MPGLERFSNGDWFLLAALCVAAVASLLASIRMFHRARLIEDMPTSKVRSAPQGYVELYGTAKWLDGPEIFAPLTGLPCTWYSYSIEERSKHGKRRWQRIDHGESVHLFLLEDDTGACVIDPEAAIVTPSVNETWYGSRRSRALNTLKAHPAIDILSKTLSRAGAPYRYTERRLNINEPLYAMGEFTSVGTDFRKEIDHLVRDFLNKLKREKKKLAAYDANQDGTIDQEEWESARKDAHQAAIQKQLENPLPRSTHLLKTPESKTQQPFLLSAKTESHLSRISRMVSFCLAMLFIVLVAGMFLKLAGKM